MPGTLHHFYRNVLRSFNINENIYPHATGVNLLFTPFNNDQNLTIAEYVRKKGLTLVLLAKRILTIGSGRNYMKMDYQIMDFIQL